MGYDEIMANANGTIQIARIVIGVVQGVLVVGIITIAAMLYEQKAQIAVIQATQVTLRQIQELVQAEVGHVARRLDDHIISGGN
jgi:hypothetical protein